MKIRKILSLSIVFLFAAQLSFVLADEGMWLPSLLKRNYEDMQKYGLKLTPEQIYDINNASLKDAIVSFGGFCTGEIVSPEGLILTNHHCGYSSIQSHSSATSNILETGFWARSKAEELPNEGLFVRFLVRMEDVTDVINQQLTDDMDVNAREQKIAEIGQSIVTDATDGTSYEANIRSFYSGNEFFLFVYETYNDVRLVGAPPSLVGKFGGDTDNWMWPRHTGDFSMFRVYAAPDGTPAEYSTENVPLKPKHYLPINISGYDNGDFAMVFGFPGRTQRYLTSYGIQVIKDYLNPSMIDLRGERLGIMKKYMDARTKTKIQYASKYASISNYHKYAIGQNEGLERLNTIIEKKKEEREFEEWASGDPDKAAKYGNLLAEYKQAYGDMKSHYLGSIYLREALLAPELVLFAWSYNGLYEKLKKGEDHIELKKELRSRAKEHFQNYNADMDREIFVALTAAYMNKIKKSQHPDLMDKTKDSEKKLENLSKKLYKKSMFADRAKLYDFLSDPSAKKLEKDWGFRVAQSVVSEYRNINSKLAPIRQKIDDLERVYIEGQMAMQPNKKFYPDANSTMRLTYGKVNDYLPRDAVHYDYFTTTEGILEKYREEDDEFGLPANLLELLQNKDFGRYAEDGKLYTCFITNNDITGGNSGSPVLNKSGELIGIAFDGNWEAMTGDLVFDEQYKRCINVDMRYVLFIIEKLGGATNLIEEMKIIPKVARPRKASSLTEANKMISDLQSKHDSLLAVAEELKKNASTGTAPITTTTPLPNGEHPGMYVVIKSFKDEKRAKKFQEKIADRRQASVIYSKKYGWYYVYTAYEKSREKAYDILGKARQEGYPDAWLYLVK